MRNRRYNYGASDDIAWGRDVAYVVGVVLVSVFLLFAISKGEKTYPPAARPVPTRPSPPLSAEEQARVNNDMAMVSIYWQFVSGF